MTPSYLSLCDQLEPRRLVYVKVTFSSPRPWRKPVLLLGYEFTPRRVEVKAEVFGRAFV